MCVSTYSPLILHETCEGIQRFDVRDQMLADRQIELAGPIDASSVACAARCLLHLQKCDPQAPVTLFINSPGGEVQSGACALRRHADALLPRHHHLPGHGRKHGGTGLCLWRSARNASAQSRHDP